jgi:hypothetical protein
MDGQQFHNVRLKWYTKGRKEGKIMRFLTALVLTVLILSSEGIAATMEVSREQLNNLPQQYSQFDVKMGWDVFHEGDGTVINGLVQNVRYFEMESIEIWVASYDLAGRELDRAVDLVMPTRLKMHEITTFTVRLKNKTPAGSKLMFTYKYLGLEGGGPENGAINWMQSFESVVPSYK